MVKICSDRMVIFLIKLVTSFACRVFRTFLQWDFSIFLVILKLCRNGASAITAAETGSNCAELLSAFQCLGVLEEGMTSDRVPAFRKWWHI